MGLDADQGHAERPPRFFAGDEGHDSGPAVADSVIDVFLDVFPEGNEIDVEEEGIAAEVSTETSYIRPATPAES